MTQIDTSNVVSWRKTTYFVGVVQHEAIYVPWNLVWMISGRAGLIHEHAVRKWLFEHGAPEWVIEADEADPFYRIPSHPPNGLILIGPPVITN